MINFTIFSKIKFSELSLDMFRFLQAVEKEPKLPEDDIAPINLNSGNKSPATGLFVNIFKKYVFFT